MAIVEVDNTPWTTVRDLLALDRWLIARKWPEPWGATPDMNQVPRVSLIERAVQALGANPELIGLVPAILDIAPGGDPVEPNGAGPDASLLRDGPRLRVAMRSEDTPPNGWRNIATIQWPGILALALGAEPLVLQLPESVLGVGYRLGRLSVFPSPSTPRVRFGWVGGASHPVLRLAIDASVPGNQIVAPVVINWRRARLEVDLIPELQHERLLWRHESRLILRTGTETQNGALEAAIEFQVRLAIARAFEEWGPLLTGALMSLPFRPVVEGRGLRALESLNFAQLGAVLLDNGYPSPHGTDPESLAGLVIASTVLPSNPLRALPIERGEDGIQPAVYPARLADHYVRHVNRPDLQGTITAPVVHFDVEPINTASGVPGELGARIYGHWTPAEPDSAGGQQAAGQFVVSREQYRIAFDHLVIPERARALVPTSVVAWTLIWRVSVRHSRLSNNAWVKVAEYVDVPAVDQWLVSAGANAVRIAWPEVNGDLAVTGELFANSTRVAWFDVGARIGEVGPSVGNSVVGTSVATSAGVLSPRNEPPPDTATPVAQLLDEHRATALVRAEPLTSLRRRTQEWLGVRVAHVHLWRPGPLQHVGPFAALFVELRIGGRPVSRRRLSAEEAGNVRASRRAIVEGPACDLYLNPDLDDPVLPLSVALMGADGETVRELAVAELPIRRDDPNQPMLRWGIHPALGRAPHFLRDVPEVLHVRVDLTDHHYDGSDVQDADHMREVDLRLHEIRIEHPTEPLGNNLGARHFEALFTSSLGAHVLREVGPIRVGPSFEDTADALNNPVVLSASDLALIGGDATARLPLPEGAVLRVRVDGAVHPPHWPLQELPLGHAAQTRAVAPDEVLDPETPWGPSALSTLDMFRFSVRTADAPPPPPRFDPVGVVPGQANAALSVPAGATLDFTYACPPWITTMRLQRRADGAENWNTVQVTLTPGVVAQDSFGVQAGVWDYRLVVWFGEQGRASREVRITATA